jgi:hypothetical protein
MRDQRPLWPALICAVALAGCHDPEDGRPRGGGHGGDGGNYLQGRVQPPSKIDGTKDLSLLQQDGPRPRGHPEAQRTAETGGGPSGKAAGPH